MTSLTLSNIDIDFEQIKQDLITYLSTQDSWKNTLTSATGSILLDIIGYLATSDKFAIQSALLEAFPDTARSDKSILAIARSFWNNHLIRKVPANVVCTLTNMSNNNITIPVYSQFSISGLDFFNRGPISLNGMTNLSVTLYQGTIQTSTQIFSGLPNQRLYLGDSADPFVISDQDIYAVVNGITTFTKTTVGIFETGPNAVPVFYENSLPTGEVEIIFGDGLYGALPNTGDSIVFTYANTLGLAGNGQVSISDQVIYNSNTNITGITTTASTGGGNELPASYYQVNGPSLRTAAVRGGGVTRAEYVAIALGYPGVIDCKLLGQAETFPGNKNYMNVLTAIILANPLFSPTQFASFVTYMQSKTIDGLQYIQQDPTPVNSTIVANIYCTAKASPETVQNQVQVALSTLQVLKTGDLGYSYYISDLVDLITTAGGATNIDYIQITSPSTDLVITSTQYVVFTSITINSYYSTRQLTVV